MIVRGLAASVLALAGLGCRPPHPGPVDAAPSPSSEAAASTGSTPQAQQSPTQPSRWTGGYTSAPGSLYVPDGKEWSGVRWRGDDAGDGIGGGTIALTLDPATRRALGTLDGVLGAARIVGIFADGALAANIERNDPTDRGFTGTLLGKVANDKADAMTGTMRLSLGDGRLIRDGTFSLTKAQ